MAKLITEHSHILAMDDDEVLQLKSVLACYCNDKKLEPNDRFSRVLESLGVTKWNGFWRYERG